MIGVILAAGKGARFGSNESKVLTSYHDKELIRYVIEAMEPLVKELIVVVGGDHETLNQLLTDYPKVRTVIQPEPLGTGHALLMVETMLTGRDEDLLISYADKPTVRTSTFQRLIDFHRSNVNKITLATAVLSNPGHKGRIVRRDGIFQEIVEYRDATPKVRSIQEVNSGFLCARSTELFKHLRKLDRKNSAGEYYLTKIFSEYVKDGYEVGTIAVEGRETVDINTLAQLRSLEKDETFPSDLT